MMKILSVSVILLFAGLVTTTIAHPAAKVSPPFQIDFQQLKSATDATHWSVLSNHRHDDLSIGRRSVTSQRVVATCRMTKNDQGRLTLAIEEEIDRQLSVAGALSKGEWSANQATSTNEFGDWESIHITAPRIQYAIDGHFGVIDLCVSAHNGHVLVTLSNTL